MVRQQVKPLRIKAPRGQSLHPKSDSGLNPESDFVIFGVDEVGAGCLAGPVVASCFAYRASSEWCAQEFLPVRVFDSKKLSEERRREASDYLIARGSEDHCAHTIVEVCNRRIDEINILWARMEAMWKAFLEAHARMSEILGSDKFLWRVFVDGNRLPREAASWHTHPSFACEEFRQQMPALPFKTVIKGDSVIFAIAAASIIAKEYRDRLMAELGDLPAYAPYKWAQNVGYPTPEHKAALLDVGYSDLHRMSFTPNMGGEAEI
jgi:ribonuclease HII